MNKVLWISVIALVAVAILGAYLYWPSQTPAQVTPVVPSTPTTPVVTELPPSDVSVDFQIVATREGFEPSRIVVPQDSLVALFITNYAINATYMINGREYNLSRGQGTTIRLRADVPNALICTHGCNVGVILPVDLQ